MCDEVDLIDRKWIVDNEPSDEMSAKLAFSYNLTFTMSRKILKISVKGKTMKMLTQDIRKVHTKKVQRLPPLPAFKEHVPSIECIKCEAEDSSTETIDQEDSAGESLY